MADIFSTEQRSRLMSLIRGKDTKPEMIVRRYLFSRGFRYRLHGKKLPGRPDLVLRRHRTVVFVHGCFWHGHYGRPCFKMPKSRTEWWEAKIARNAARDAFNRHQLAATGWRVVVVWECALRTVALRAQTLADLERMILGNHPDEGNLTLAA